MPVQDDRKLLDRTKPSPADHMVLHFDPWRAHNLGTTTASITVPCPDIVVGNRRPQVAIQTLYATGTGAGGIVTIASGADTILQYRLMDARPIQLNFYPGNVTIEPGQNLTISIAGATAGASISATGVIYR
jgi:hypothetical protein